MAFREILSSNDTLKFITAMQRFMRKVLAGTQANVL